MQTLNYLLDGFAVALTWKNLLYCLLGCVWGTVVGVLPGLGPLAGMALLLPLTYGLEPTTAMITLSGIFYGAMYGGSTTSILVRIPGEAASIVTCIDGYEMTKRGRAGPALAIAAIGSAVGGVFSIVGLMLFAPPLATLMLAVGPAAEFTLMVLVLTAVCMMSSGGVAKTAAMVLLGLLLATIGVDQLTAWPRFTFGDVRLTEGFSFVAVAIGLFGISEILLSFEQNVEMKPQRPRLAELVPTAADMRQSAGPIARGSLIGFLFGLMPGVSHIISTFVSYAVEKRLSRNPEEFGRGAIAGVAGPETANNATTGSSLIPLLVLGIPAIPSTAILLNALLIHKVQPGPGLIADHPQIFWGLIASMFVGNLILIILNLPLVGVFVTLLRLPYGWLAPTVLIISLVGVYGVSASEFDLIVLTAFGAIGYVLRKLEYDLAPLLLALVVGDRMELGFRRALFIANGDYTVFVRGGAAQVFLATFAVLIGLLLAARLFGYRRAMASEEPQEQPPPA